MRTELSFLMELFLSDEIPKPIKVMVAERIREVESSLNAPTVKLSGRAEIPHNVPYNVPRETLSAQAPSMQKIMEANSDLIVTPAATAALQHRANLIKNALNEKPESGRTSPRKI